MPAALDHDLRSYYFTFSPDSKRWGYIAQINQKKYGVISGSSYGPYEFLSVPDEEAYIYFSPDSAHFAFMACTGGGYNHNYEPQLLVVDGVEHQIHEGWLSGSVLRFNSPTNLHGLIMGKDRISRLEVEISMK